MENYELKVGNYEEKKNSGMRYRLHKVAQHAKC